MLDARVLTRIREHINAELRPRERTLGIALRDNQSHVASRGLLGSGAAINLYASTGREELTVRARMIWAAIRRSHASLVGRLDETTLVDLRQQIAEFLAEQTAQVLEQTLSRVGDHERNQRERAALEEQIRERSRELEAQLDVEAQFYVDELQRAAAAAAAVAAGDREAATLHFHAPVGSVQTGAYATAHVSMGGADSERLRAALEAFAHAVEENREIVGEQREQALELVRDTVAATRAERPNAPKIAGLLGGVSTVVRTVASLRPAYETLRDVAIAIGFYLQ